MRAHQSVSREDIDKLLLDKLPEVSVEPLQETSPLRRFLKPLTATPAIAGLSYLLPCSIRVTSKAVILHFC